jgi:hypothetical protein
MWLIESYAMECSKVSSAMSRAEHGRLNINNQVTTLIRSQCVLSVSARGRIMIQAPRFQSSGGMAWHGLLARRAEERWLWAVSFLQFQGATGAEAPSHGCRAARLLCAFV